MAPVFPSVVVSSSLVAALMAAMASKHFVSDFLLQTSWMARGKERTSDWFAPLIAHGLVHAGVLLLVLLLFCPALWWLALVDLVVHSTIDRGKALVGQATRFTTADERFWWLLGFDQLLHQLTNVAFVCLILIRL